MSAQNRKVSTEEKVDRFWQMLEESPGHLKLVDPDSESPAVLWDIVCDKEMKLEGPLCTSIAEQVNVHCERGCHKTKATEKGVAPYKPLPPKSSKGGLHEAPMLSQRLPITSCAAHYYASHSAHVWSYMCPSLVCVQQNKHGSPDTKESNSSCVIKQAGSSPFMYVTFNI